MKATIHCARNFCRTVRPRCRERTLIQSSRVPIAPKPITTSSDCRKYRFERSPQKTAATTIARTMKIPPMVGVSRFFACNSFSLSDALTIRSRKRSFNQRIAWGPKIRAVTNETRVAKAIRAVRNTRESPVETPARLSTADP